MQYRLYVSSSLLQDIRIFPQFKPMLAQFAQLAKLAQLGQLAQLAQFNKFILSYR